MAKVQVFLPEPPQEFSSDAFRQINKNPHQYTWLSNRGQARSKNIGWRIDYQITSPSLKNKIINSDIYKDMWFSDHAPLTIEYNYSIS